MKHQEIALRDEEVSAANPFGVPAEGPMQPQAAVQKYAPKTIFDGDIGTLGGRGGGG